jgi:hypothetical protein
MVVRLGGGGGGGYEGDEEGDRENEKVYVCVRLCVWEREREERCVLVAFQPFRAFYSSVHICRRF